MSLGVVPPKPTTTGGGGMMPNKVGACLLSFLKSNEMLAKISKFDRKQHCPRDRRHLTSDHSSA